jgi:hypothetical protein
MNRIIFLLFGILLFILIIVNISIKNSFSDLLAYDPGPPISYNKYGLMIYGEYTENTLPIFINNNSPNMIIQYKTPMSSELLNKYPIFYLIDGSSGSTSNTRLDKNTLLSNKNLIDLIELYKNPEKYIDIKSGDPTQGNNTITLKLTGHKDIIKEELKSQYQYYLGLAIQSNNDNLTYYSTFKFYPLMFTFDSSSRGQYIVYEEQMDGASGVQTG